MYKKVALLVENSRAYGRSLCEGIAAFAQENRTWLPQILSPEVLPDAVKSREFDGFVVRLVDEETERLLRSSRKPVVDVFCCRRSPFLIGVDCDHRAIAEKAADYFHFHSFTRFAFCGVPGIAFSELREQAYLEKVKELGFDCFLYRPGKRDATPLTDRIFYRERADEITDSEDLRQWVADLPKPIAVFCANDLRAYQLLQVCRLNRISIPHQVAILGVDNDTLLCSFTVPPLSSLNPNAFEVGYTAAKLLDQAMEKSVSASGLRKMHTVLPGEIVERASTEVYPFEPDWLSNVLVHIDQNLSRPVMATEIFQIAQRSHTAVESVFRKTFGMSVQKYITTVKLKKAKVLLETTDMRVSEVAVNTGFMSPQYFCRVYKAHFGTTPGGRFAPAEKLRRRQ